MTDRNISLLCAVENCGRKSAAKGLCWTHYEVGRRGGDPYSYEIAQQGDPAVNFFRYVVKRSGCWAWTGYKDKNGYGRVRVGTTKKPASRFSYEYHIGPVPDDLMVCHSCDNPECTNPEHLWIGTAKDNSHDMVAKNRGAKSIGEQSNFAKITEASVKEIRRLAESGEEYKAIAKRFGVTASNISYIVRRKTWRHI